MKGAHASVDPEIDVRMRGPGRQPGARVTVHHRFGETVVQERQVPLGSAIRPMREQDVPISDVRHRCPDR
ncbi:hypothetical protein [Caballeronia mineralivorans]|uniref:hypothetical protein n=1 Tax=Caballeronia mineralivorans TaxID=2010198 RepID=UPI00128B5F58|nr:hypothetical protein [Caballeronia mineralivorans]